MLVFSRLLEGGFLLCWHCKVVYCRTRSFCLEQTCLTFVAPMSQRTRCMRLNIPFCWTSFGLSAKLNQLQPFQYLCHCQFSVSMAWKDSDLMWGFFGRVLNFNSWAGWSGALCLIAAGAACDVCAGWRVHWKLERGLRGQERQPPAKHLKLAGWRSSWDRLLFIWPYF